MKLTRKDNCYKAEHDGYFYHIEKALEGPGYEIQVTKNGRSEWLTSICGNLKQVRERIENGSSAIEYEGLCECIDNGSAYAYFD